MLHIDIFNYGVPLTVPTSDFGCCFMNLSLLQNFTKFYNTFFTFDVLLLFVNSQFQCIPHILLYHSFLSFCSHYYSYALELIAQNKLRLQFYEYSSLQCIEMAIWPLLYLKESWCETNISGQVYNITYIFQLQYISQKKTLFIK